MVEGAMEEMISLSGLTKKFGSITAVDDISLSVKRGEVLGFLGPNGAGKSTTMRMITGFVPPTAGTVTVCGHNVAENSMEVQKRIGYMPEGAPIYGDIPPAAFLKFVAGVRGFRGDERKRRVDAAVDKLQIADVLHRPIDTLSKGYRRRTGLAQAILHDPDILVLDEPTDGLDPNQKFQVRSLIRDMGKEKAIVISTHILEEVEAVCSRAAVIAKGRVVFDGTPAELQRLSARHNAVTVTLSNDVADTVRTAFEAIPGVSKVEASHGSDHMVNLVVIPEDGRSIIRDVSDRVRRDGIVVDALFIERGHLDEVFRQLTTA